MKIRKLQTSEHGKTRTLWEQAFPEDSREFLDYYYFLKTQENEIYVVEEKEKFCSMLQLNPYQIQMGEQTFIGHYIIAVATDPAYRKRGFMGTLLRRSMQDMYDRGELFTFLMPADERIYTPYDFRFVYDQDVFTYVRKAEDEKALEKGNYELLEASYGDGSMLATFFNDHFADRYQIYATRDEHYYQTLVFEQQSEHGGVRILKRENCVIGTFLYGDEGELEIREALCLSGYENAMYGAFSMLCKEKGYQVAQVAASSWNHKKEQVEKNPVIMFRILHLEDILKILKMKKGEKIDCSFAVLDPLLTRNSRVWRLTGGEEKNQIIVSETEDSEGILTIGAMSDLLFGYRTIEEIAQEENVFLTEHLMMELKKLEPLDRIFLNEIV